MSIEVNNESGIEVESGVMEAEAKRAHAAHLWRLEMPLPYVVLKLAVSADDAIGRVGERHDHGRRKAHQRKRLQADRLAVKIAIKTDQAARQRGDAKTQHNLRPIQQCVTSR